MRNLIATLFLSLSILPSAFAREGDVVVECNSIPFDDIRSIEIIETDLTGQYVMVEAQKDRNVYSPAFSYADLVGGNLPALSGWNGYERRLVRSGVNDYTIRHQDECSGGISSVSCKESF